MSNQFPQILMADDEWQTAGWDRVFARKIADINFLFESEAERVATHLQDNPDIACLLLDITFEKQSIQGLEILTEVRHQFPELPIIMLTADADHATAARFGRLGVFDYFSKEQLDLERLKITIHNAFNQSRMLRQLKSLREDAMIGASGEINALRRMINAVAQLSDSVLILGESGVGKTLVAKAIHKASNRAAGSFVQISPADYPPTILESALFGHRRGSFTDAREERKGLLAEADGGTLFLDEIGELPPEMQTKLLHFLQEKRFRPLGENKEQSVDTRILLATNQDLDKMMDDGAMRRDFFYRISQVTVTVPPLRTRHGDIELLSNHFLLLKREASETEVNCISSDAMELLNSHSWLGNIRELQNAISYALLQARLMGVPELLPEHFRLDTHRLNSNSATELSRPSKSSPQSSGPQQTIPKGFPVPPEPSTDGIPLSRILAKIELYYLENALQLANGKKTRAHTFLQMNDRFSFQRTVVNRLREFPDLRAKFSRLASVYSDHLPPLEED